SPRHPDSGRQQGHPLHDREEAGRRVRRLLTKLGVGQPHRAASIAATSIFFMSIIASKARLASAPPTAIASVRTRGVICQEMPHLSLHQPHALSSPPLPTMAF